MISFADIAGKIQKISAKARMIGFVVFLVAMAVLFIYFVYIPKTKQIASLEKDLVGLISTINANDERIRKLDDLRREVKSLDEKLRLLTEQLPPGSEVSGLLRQIQNLVTQSGLSLKVWRPSQRRTHASGLYEEIPIAINLTGGYHDLGILLDRISKMTRIVNVLNLTMGSASMDKAGRIDIKISCTALTFAAVEKKPDAAPAVKKTQ